MLDKNAVWFITGCSKGLGRALAEEALAAGYRVVLTARDAIALGDIVAKHGDAALALALDVTQPEQVKAAVAAAEARFGAIDVLVNNAGYGYVAAIEEGDEAQVRALFETNVFGLWAMTKAVLPGMRARRRGHIVNLSSIGGLTTFSAYGFYYMTKFAVEAFSETLAKEVSPLGLGVTVVEPGAFRTDFRGGSLQLAGTQIAAYADTAGKNLANVLAGHGKQAGDPARAARAIITALQAEKPPLHLVLGPEALDLARQKLADLQKDFDGWEEVTRGTNFAD